MEPRVVENGHIAVKWCRHGLFAYNVNDRFIGRSLDAYGEWCDAELSLLFQVLTPGDVVVDVGANIGTHTVALAKRVTSSGVVLALEPQRHAFQLLCANVALNALANVDCRNVAASDAPGVTRIPVLEPTAENNFGAMHVDWVEEGEDVGVIRLDDLGLVRCNLIKIDVEGMEARVLAGAQAVVRTLRPVLYLENNNEERSRATLTALDDLGYSCWWHLVSYYNPENFFGNETPLWDYREVNVLCFPKESRVDAQGFEPVRGLDDSPEDALRRLS